MIFRLFSAVCVLSAGLALSACAGNDVADFGAGALCGAQTEVCLNACENEYGVSRNPDAYRTCQRSCETAPQRACDPRDR